MQTFLERPQNPDRSLRPANFHQLQGWTVSELHTHINELLASGKWKGPHPSLSRATIYNWERDTGHKLDRRCTVCKERKSFDQMRIDRTDTCYKCTPPARMATNFSIVSHGRKGSKMTHAQLERDLQRYIEGGGTITHCPPPVDPRHPATAETFGTLRYRRPD